MKLQFQVNFKIQHFILGKKERYHSFPYGCIYFKYKEQCCLPLSFIRLNITYFLDSQSLIFQLFFFFFWLLASVVSLSTELNYPGAMVTAKKTRTGSQTKSFSRYWTGSYDANRSSWVTNLKQLQIYTLASKIDIEDM